MNKFIMGKDGLGTMIPIYNNISKIKKNSEKLKKNKCPRK